MRIQEVKKIICVLFIFGFFTGILYLNIFARNWILSMGIFSDYFLEQYSGNKIDTSSYIWYVTKLRVFPFLLMAIPVSLIFKRITAVLYLVWTGFSSGLILTTAIVKLGLKGIILCVVGILPHFICYVMAFVMIFIYLFAYPDVKWNHTKTISITVFLSLGIITETYINPALLEMFIGLL